MGAFVGAIFFSVVAILSSIAGNDLLAQVTTTISTLAAAGSIGLGVYFTSR